MYVVFFQNTVIAQINDYKVEYRFYQGEFTGNQNRTTDRKFLTKDRKN